MQATIHYETKATLPKGQETILDKQSSVTTETPCRWVALSKEKAREIAEEAKRAPCHLRNTAKDYIYGP